MGFCGSCDQPIDQHSAEEARGCLLVLSLAVLYDLDPADFRPVETVDGPTFRALLR